MSRVKVKDILVLRASCTSFVNPVIGSVSWTLYIGGSLSTGPGNYTLYDNLFDLTETGETRSSDFRVTKRLFYLFNKAGKILVRIF